jgi:hypothetical protein
MYVQGQFANIFNQAVLEINPNHAIIKVSDEKMAMLLLRALIH